MIPVNHRKKPEKQTQRECARPSFFSLHFRDSHPRSTSQTSARGWTKLSFLLVGYVMKTKIIPVIRIFSTTRTVGEIFGDTGVKASSRRSAGPHQNGRGRHGFRGDGLEILWSFLRWLDRLDRRMTTESRPIQGAHPEREQGVSFRMIAEQVGCSLASVQRVHIRQKAVNYFSDECESMTNMPTMHS